LTGTGSDLDLMTFKLTDQLSGRMMGVRADITPQAARIDAHHLCCDAPTRLCYLGTVLHTRSDGFAGTRSPLQIGAELYGHQGVESDIEILRLMMQTMALAGVKEVYLDLGHVGIFKGLAQQAGLDGDQETCLFDALQRKAVPEIEQLLQEFEIDASVSAMFSQLAELSGDDALERAETVLAQAAEPVKQALAYLQEMADQLKIWLPDVPVHFDLAELRGYHFHTGVVFAAFVPESGKEVARGGRYDDIGKVFGRARPATGFSTDLKTLIRAATPASDGESTDRVVFAPWSADPAQQELVAQLRGEGCRVVTGLPGQLGGAKEMGCDEQLIDQDGEWKLVSV
jgi:ATP phosphoribosyltransferase regulatory subunit